MGALSNSQRIAKFLETEDFSLLEPPLLFQQRESFTCADCSCESWCLNSITCFWCCCPRDTCCQWVAFSRLPGLKVRLRPRALPSGSHCPCCIRKTQTAVEWSSSCRPAAAM